MYCKVVFFCHGHWQLAPILASPSQSAFNKSVSLMSFPSARYRDLLNATGLVLEVCSCCSLTVLPSPAWILRRICAPPYSLSWSLPFLYSLKIIDSICSYVQPSYCCPAGTYVVTGERWRLLHFTAAGSLQAPPAVNISHFEMPRQAKRWRAGGRTLESSVAASAGASLALASYLLI